MVEKKKTPLPLCHICQRPIHRNLISNQGYFYHHGCLKNADYGLKVYICENCGEKLRKEDLTITFFNGSSEKSCPKCGSPFIRRLYPKNKISEKNSFLCNVCHKPILRNSFWLNGLIFHYACLKKKTSLFKEIVYLCPACRNWLTPQGLSPQQSSGVACSICYNTKLRPIKPEELHKILM